MSRLTANLAPGKPKAILGRYLYRRWCCRTLSITSGAPNLVIHLHILHNDITPDNQSMAASLLPFHSNSEQCIKDFTRRRRIEQGREIRARHDETNSVGTFAAMDDLRYRGDQSPVVRPSGIGRRLASRRASSDLSKRRCWA